MFSILAPKKKCTKCGEWKTLDSFRVRKIKSGDWVNTQCKACEVDAARQWQADNRDKHLANKRRFREQHKDEENARSVKWRHEHPEKAKAICARWRENNRELARERTKAWGERNHAKRNGYASKYRKANPIKRLMLEVNRRARKLANGGEITAAEWEGLKAKYNYTCLCCKHREPDIKLTLDHVIPISMGGKNVIENAQPLCQSCNSSKGNRRTTDYR